MFAYEWVYYLSFDMDPLEQKFLTFKEQVPNAEKIPREIWSKCGSDMGFTGCSSGAVVLTHLLRYYPEVHIYGFDFFQSRQHHYGDTVKKGLLHKAPYEKRFFEDLIAAGRVVPLNDYLGLLNFDADGYQHIHESIPAYGIGGSYFKAPIVDLAERVNASSVLDYACGKGRLVDSLSSNGFTSVVGYDPFCPPYTAFPGGAFDLVVTTDFLEHLSEEDLEDHFRIMLTFNPRGMFHTISNRLAAQILHDGTNAHKTVRPPEWWQDRLQKAFKKYTVRTLLHNDNQNFTTYEAVRNGT